MSSLCPSVVAYISWISLVHCIIIFNNDTFIIDAPFENIKNGVTSGNMKCGLENEGLESHQNKYNGTHIIFSYIQHCDRRSMKDYEKKEHIYFNEFMDCSLDYPLRRCGWRRTNYFEFDDTCSIEYNQACDNRFLGPCVSSPENSTTSITAIVLDDETKEFTTEDVQSKIGDIITCDPIKIQNKQENTTEFEKYYQMFYYGRHQCVIQIKHHYYYRPGCGGHAGFRVQGRYGHKLSEQAVNKSEVFH